MDEQALDVRVESLARELASTINTGATESREHLRELAIELIRDEVQIVPILSPVPAAAATFNPFGVGIPLLLAGFVLLILFPLVGVMLLMAAGVMMAWGVAATLLTRR